MPCDVTEEPQVKDAADRVARELGTLDVAIRPSAVTSAATASSSPARRPDTATSAPRRASSSASARPIPLPPPVTQAAFPSKRLAMRSE